MFLCCLCFLCKGKLKFIVKTVLFIWLQMMSLILETKSIWLKISHTYACKNLGFFSWIFFICFFSDEMMGIAICTKAESQCHKQPRGQEGHINKRSSKYRDSILSCLWRWQLLQLYLLLPKGGYEVIVVKILWLLKKKNGYLIFIWNCYLRNIHLISNLSPGHRCDL